ncbi:MAG: hypoxanthine phosphoribosyltransferase [Candidatus Tectomicrobia bacterium]|uniref:Hypoxanthine phosphoribosyltransferase n=1 Tax=Tectimicrobiota bacterium TaxID=2528274 RepID=A0A932GQ03_UNCTE|nr:hypoxanthine phosphoribosyltransferase [Candidatus Tectomicrobia bacterium]
MSNEWEVLISAEALQRRVRELGEAISRDYAGREPLLVGILRGAWVFLADLVRCISIPIRCDFMGVSSYGPQTESQGLVRITSDLSEPVTGQDLLVVEDIVDTGLTIDYLLRNLSARRPRTLKICTLLNKPDRRRVEIPLDYVGFNIPSCFVIGYGLDYNQHHRELPFIATLPPSALSVSPPG